MEKGLIFLNSHKKIIHLIIVSSLLFLTLIGYLTYFQIFRAAALARNPYNRRQWAREEYTLRGTIYDRNGIVIAETHEDNQHLVRRYPYNNLYSHIVGYSHQQYGRSGIEAQYNDQLMGYTSDGMVARLRDRITGDYYRGNHVYLTLNHQLQQKALSLIQGKTGGIVALNPTTGEVLAMVSVPDFNPNRLQDDWSWLVEDNRSPLINRVTSGLYPPGSSFKPVITAAILEMENIDTYYECTGSIVIDGYTLSDARVQGHGPIDLRRSLIVSCNTNFARMAQILGERRVSDITRRFRIGSNLRADFNTTNSRMPYEEGMSATDLAAVAIGQGRLQMTPLHMAMIAATIANDGVMMEPRIIKEIITPEGRGVEYINIKGSTIISSEIAGEIKSMMVGVVDEGTGWNAQIPGIKVAGKTGTAENQTGATHGWFIAFAPADNPQIAVAVLLESEGRSGGEAAAPLARELIRTALEGGLLD